MKYFLLAGEPSGDNHGASLMKAILEQNRTAEFAYVGGPSMANVAPGMVVNIKELSVMGFGEVLLKLPKIIKVAGEIKKAILEFSPDIVLFIDNPGLNLRLAKWVKSKGFKTAYYILPKAWAWNASRVQKLKKYIDLNLSILPFEVGFFAKHGLHVHYVGNPSKEAVGAYKTVKIRTSDKPVLAILPGSRAQEIKKLLPTLLEAAGALKDYSIVVSKAPNLDISFYKPFIEAGMILSEDYYGLLSSADLAIVTSGTATLETALFNVPQVVCYKTSFLSYSIAKKLIQVDHISLVNLIAGEAVVKELIQKECTVENIISEIQRLANLTQDDRQAFYIIFRNQLGDCKSSKNTTNLIAQELEKN